MRVRAPFDGARLLRFLRARAIPRVERVDDDRYTRVVSLGGAIGHIVVRVADSKLGLELSPSLERVKPEVVAGVKRLFDVDADVTAIATVLRRDPLLAPCVNARPGLRVPGAIDGFEMAIRALLGQQVTVAGATTLTGRFAAAFGTRYPAGEALGVGVRFPRADVVVKAGVDAVAAIGLPRARASAIVALADRWRRTPLVSGRRTPDLDATVAALCELPGVGPWTAQYLAMRALHHPDAFPGTDLGVRKALGGASDKVIAARAEAWRPYRAYAVMHLWTHLAEAQAPG
jgi:AraC family transcriptional regulator, regulatory protein of adaptative response / DNA-3-methyladenine glycosylase II